MPFSKRQNLLQENQRGSKKLGPQVIQAAITLGVDVRRQIDNAISFVIELPTPMGLKKAHALLDSSTQANFISQLWAKDNDLQLQPTP